MKNIMITSAIGCLMMVTVKTSLAQTGACCIDFECDGTMEMWPCLWIGGYWYEGEDCDEGFECPTDFPCGFYVVGDFNCSGELNVADVVDMYSRLRTGNPVYPDCECDCLGDGKIWPVTGDVNNSCTFNIADVVILYRGGLIPERWLWPCVYCPPAPGP